MRAVDKFLTEGSILAGWDILVCTFEMYGFGNPEAVLIMGRDGLTHCGSMHYSLLIVASYYKVCSPRELQRVQCPIEENFDKNKDFWERKLQEYAVDLYAYTTNWMWDNMEV